MKKTLALTLAAAMTLSLAACGSSASSASSAATSTESTSTDTSAATSTAAESGTVENKDKPLVWFNRQPSNSTTGELDTEALNFNGNTYYVGFDANQGAELQGKMIADYIKAHADTIDRNGDGVIGYVLAIGDIGHNDSIARTRGVRSALGTAVEGSSGIVSDPVGTNADGSATQVQDGTIDVNGTTFSVRELASQEMKNSAGATWDAGTASNAISAWASSLEIPSISLFPTMTAWAWQCLTPGRRKMAFPPLATMQTLTQLLPLPTVTAERSASTLTCRPT